MKILVTGGTGYIGSHTVVELLNNNYDVVIIDNLINSKVDVVDKIKQITNKDVKFVQWDVGNYNTLSKVFLENKIDAVIHFAGLKAVRESVKEPLKYYEGNVGITLNLLHVMQEHNCKNIIFSSSTTVYGAADKLPIREDFPLSRPSNPYGTTKLMIEYILKDIYNADRDWKITLLRYFNPIGSEKTGLLGENPKGIPNNLMPYIVRVAIGELEYLNVFGDDYPTHDGTGVRNYIHVVDLAKGHVKALENNISGIHIYNLGTGKGYSVLDLVKTFEKVNNVRIPYKIVARRAGDIAEYYSDPSKAKQELHWETRLNIEDMCRDSYNYIIRKFKINI